MMCNKDVKEVLKGLEQYADPASSFNVRCRKHFRVSWEMLNDNEEKVKVMVTVPTSPSYGHWKHQHRVQLKKRFRELNISSDVTHI